MAWTAQIGGNNVIVEQDDYGHWALVQNYEHFGGENPTVSEGSVFPSLPNGETNISDIQNLGTSGELKHVDSITQYSSAFDQVDAVRLEAMTSNHNRKINFFNEDSTVVASVLDNSTSPTISDWTNLVTKYPDHSANLPDSAGSANADANTNRIFEYEFPFYNSGTHHWCVKARGNIWGVDDWPDGGGTNAEQYTTIHRVWVRLPQGVPSPSTVKRTTSDEILKT